MTSQLPVLARVAEAEAYARRWLDERKDLVLLGLGVPILHQNAGHDGLQRLLKSKAMSGPHGMQWVLVAARVGSEDADEALRDLYSELRHHCRDIPPALQAYADEVVLRGPLRRKRGRRKSKHEFQNILFMALTLEIVQQFDLNPTRNREAGHYNSACDVVALVVRETKWLNRQIRYDRLEELWGFYFAHSKVWRSERNSPI